MDHFDIEQFLQDRLGEKRKVKKSHWDTASADYFLRVFTYAAEKPERFKAFIDQFLSNREWRELTRRLRVANLLFAGLSYKEISAITFMSPAGISRLSKRLRGKTEGVYDVLSRVHTERRIEEDKRAGL